MLVDNMGTSNDVSSTYNMAAAEDRVTREWELIHFYIHGTKLAWHNEDCT